MSQGNRPKISCGGGNGGGGGGGGGRGGGDGGDGGDATGLQMLSKGFVDSALSMANREEMRAHLE